MKKMLIVMPSLTNGGAERSLVNFLTELGPDYAKVDLLLFKRKGMFLSQVPDYVNILHSEKELTALYAPISKAGRFLPLKLWGNFISGLMTKGIYEKRAYRWHHYYGRCVPKMKESYDVAIAYIAEETGYFVRQKADAKRKIAFIHNDYRAAGFPKKYDLPTFKDMDALASISEACVQILREEFPMYRDKIYLLPNIISSGLIRKQAEKFVPEEYKPGQTTFLSIGRLSEQKGFDMAIEAAAILKSRGLDFHWFVIGTGALEGKLKQLTAQKGVEDCFTLLGARENPYPYISRCTVLAQPSRFEGKSMVLDEAKILAAPILATDYATVRDQLIDGQEGVIVPMNAQGIADGLTRLSTDKELRESLRAWLNGHEYGNQSELKRYKELMEGGGEEVN